MRKNLRTIMLRVGCGLLVGLFVYAVVFASIDRDFYSQYYTARGIFSGSRLYGDFSDNKGPVLYLFFVPLYSIFRDQFSWAYFVGTILIHGLTLFGMGLYVGMLKFWKRDNFLEKLFIFGMIGLFGFGFVLEGIYAESVGMLFLIWGLLLLQRKQFVLTGFFVLAGLACRQTLLFFIPYFGYEYIRLKLLSRKSIKELLLGAGLLIVLLFSYLFLTSDIGNFFHNAVQFNLQYAQAVQPAKYKSVFYGIYNYGTYRPLIALLLTLLIVIFCLFKRKIRYGVRLGVLWVCSLLVVFSGGLFYQHHFWQFLIAMGLTMVFIIQYFRNTVVTFFLTGYLFVTTVLIVAISVLGSGGSIFETGSLYPLSHVIQDKKYMVVMSFNPELYWIYDKQAPDKYFQPFFLSQLFNTRWQEEFAVHVSNLQPVVDETAFVQTSNYGQTNPLGELYLRQLKTVFPLTELSRIRVLNSDHEVVVYGIANQTNAN